MGDVLTKPKEKGGLNLGTGGSSLVLVTILIAFIIYTSLKARKNLEPSAPAVE